MRSVTNAKVVSDVDKRVHYTHGDSNVKVDYHVADVKYAVVSAGSVTDMQNWVVLGTNGGFITRQEIPKSSGPSIDLQKSNKVYWLEVERQQAVDLCPVSLVPEGGASRST